MTTSGDVGSPNGTQNGEELGIITGKNEMGWRVMKVSAAHEKLTLLAQKRFKGFTPHQVVTFLNQSLKGQGLIFGLRQFDEEWELTVYDVRNVEEP